MKKTHQIILIILTFALVIAGALYAYFLFGAGQDGPQSIKAYASQMIELCKDEPHRPTCYEREVPKLVSEMPTEEIFDVVRQIRRDDPEYLYCHVLAHELGVYEVGLDPQNWLDVVAKGPTDGLCSNGFAHGAIVARFNDEDLSREEFDYSTRDVPGNATGMPKLAVPSAISD